MTLEEAIKHAEDVARNCDILAEQSVVEQAEYHNRKCAAEHRQLAEWLKELKERMEKDVPDTNVGSMKIQLSAESTTNLQPTCKQLATDAISKREAIEAVEKESQVDGAYGYMDTKSIIDLLNALPSAQPEPSTEIQEILNYLDTTLHPIVSPDNWNVYAELHDMVSRLPSAQPEWNNHTVACLLAELFDDTCACNYNGTDEWLPEKCEVIDSCPNPVGVACWEQYLKHRAERRTDEID